MQVAFLQSSTKSTHVEPFRLVLLMIATVKITMSKWQHCIFDNWKWLSVLFCCERKWTKNNRVFNWKVLLFKFTK